MNSVNYIVPDVMKDALKEFEDNQSINKDSLLKTMNKFYKPEGISPTSFVKLENKLNQLTNNLDKYQILKIMDEFYNDGCENTKPLSLPEFFTNKELQDDQLFAPIKKDNFSVADDNTTPCNFSKSNSYYTPYKNNKIPTMKTEAQIHPNNPSTMYMPKQTELKKIFIDDYSIDPIDNEHKKTKPQPEKKTIQTDYKLSYPFGNMMMNNSFDNELPFFQDFSPDFSCIEMSKIVYTRYHEIVVPINIGVIKSENFTLGLGNLCNQFGANLLGKTHLVFNKNIQIKKMVLYYHNENKIIIDCMDKSTINMLKTLKYVSDENISTNNKYFYELPFFFTDHKYAFPASKYPNLFVDIEFESKSNPIMEVITTLYYLSSLEADKFSASHYDINILQLGMNKYSFTYDNMHNNDELFIHLPDFQYNVSCIFINIIPTNDVNITLSGYVLLNGNAISLIDDTVSKMALFELTKNFGAKNIYYIPFSIDKLIRNEPWGYLSVKKHSLSLKIDIAVENNQTPENIIFEIIAPRHNILSFGSEFNPYDFMLKYK